MNTYFDVRLRYTFENDTNPNRMKSGNLKKTVVNKN